MAVPHKVHASVTGQPTELVCFRLDERLALSAIGELDANPDVIRTLRLGSFVSWIRLSGQRLSGRVF